MAEAVFDLIDLALSKAEEGKYEEGLRILRKKWAGISRSLKGQEREEFRSIVIGTEALILSKINPEESAAKYEEALEIQERLLKKGVDGKLANWASVTHNNYGNLLSDLRRYEEAEEHYKRALELNPDDFFAGMILYNLVIMFLDARKGVKNKLREMVLHLSKCELFSKDRAGWTVRAAYLLKRAAASSPDIEVEFSEYLMELENEAKPEGGLQFLKLCRALLIRATRLFEAAALIGEVSAWFRQKTGVDVSWTRSPTKIYYSAEVKI